MGAYHHANTSLLLCLCQFKKEECNQIQSPLEQIDCQRADKGPHEAVAVSRTRRFTCEIVHAT